jgi:hypothetical protein
MRACALAVVGGLIAFVTISRVQSDVSANR